MDKNRKSDKGLAKNEDLSPRDEAAADVKGGATNQSDGSLDQRLHFKYDIKGNKEG